MDTLQYEKELKNQINDSLKKTKNNEIITEWNSISQTNMSKLFKEPVKFNQNINEWNISNVTNMEKMFNKKKIKINKNI